MAELNYQPNAVAQSLSRQKSFLLGVVTVGLKFFGPSRTLSGITSKAEELGYGLLLKELASSNSTDVMPLLQWFKSHQVDGIIWAAPEIEDNRFWLKDILPLIDIPIIFLTMEEQNNVSIVTTDNYNGAKAATEYFIQHGRKNIAHITGPLDWWESRQRKIGWETVLSETGVQVTDRMWSEGNWSSKSGKTAFLDLMNKYPEMDAILVGNDQMALGIFQSALEIGKKIPQEISVIGFDDIPEPEFFTPSLSTVNPNQEELGKVAVTELITQIEQKLEEKIGNEPKYIMIQPELIIRKSS
jgi:LacI family transcriptional regulator